MCIARPIEGYRGLVETCRQRADELSLSRLEIDRLAGLPAGYSGKLLGKDNSVPRKKRMWPASLEAVLGALGLQIIVIVDHAAASRTLSRRVPVDRTQQRVGESHWRTATKQPKEIAGPLAPKIEKRPEPGSRAHLRVIQGKRRGSKHG
jgi:hypothetical protein